MSNEAESTTRPSRKSTISVEPPPMSASSPALAPPPVAAPRKESRASSAPVRTSTVRPVTS